MAFDLVVRLPDPQDTVHPSDPGLRRVCGTPLLTRLLVGAARHGAHRIGVVGPGLERARTAVAKDPRLSPLDLRWGSEPEPSSLPRVEVTADVVVATAVWRLLDEADGPVWVPGAPHMRRGGGGRARPLWEEPPRGCYAIAVRSRSEARAAKRAIFANITKSTSGPVSRHFNAKFSIPLSKVLVETPTTPNQMTMANTVLGVLGAGFCAVGTAASLAVGALLLQLTSALDRCDGELARSKLMESERGAWFDSWGDNITYVAYMVGLTVGYARFADALGTPWAPYIGPLGFGILALTLLLIGAMFYYVHRNNLGGTMSAISQRFRQRVGRERAGLVYRLLDKVKVLGERDQFSLAFAALGLLPFLLGQPAYYHALFFSTVGFVLLANAYFLIGALKARGTSATAAA